MEKIVEIGLREGLLRDLDSIAIHYGVTKERWIKETIIKALRSEKARDKIMKVVSEEYMDGKYKDWNVYTTDYALQITDYHKNGKVKGDG
jgi:hypothetical protein